jgi:hypothetical protein
VKARAALPALLAALACGAAGALPARAGDGIDPGLKEMFERVLRDEAPTPEDQRRAERALRDWQLSERNSPSVDRRTEPLLQALAEGRKPPPELVARARELYDDYLTPEGRRRRELSAALSGRSPGGSSILEGPPESTGERFLVGVLVLVVIGGVAVAVVSGRRGRPDQHAW